MVDNRDASKYLYYTFFGNKNVTNPRRIEQKKIKQMNINFQSISYN